MKNHFCQEILSRKEIDAGTRPSKISSVIGVEYGPSERHGRRFRVPSLQSQCPTPMKGVLLCWFSLDVLTKAL